jgi:hypothetical protein
MMPRLPKSSVFSMPRRIPLKTIAWSTGQVMPGMQQDNRNGRWSAAADLAARCPFAPNSFGGHRIRVRAIEIAAKGRPAGRPPAWTRPQASIADYLTGALDVFTTLVEAYEAHHYPIPEPDPVEAIKYYMESRGLSRADLEPYIDGRARG